jgi:hypothetical protein
MKRLLISAITIIAALASMIPSAQAATNTGTFNVNIALTSGCAVDTTATAANFTYTGLQVGAATFSTSFNLQCTSGLPITSVALDSLALTDAATNLAYTLALGATPASNGSANAVTVTGNMPGNQAGTCAGASCTNALSANRTRTVTVTY